MDLFDKEAKKRVPAMAKRAIDNNIPLEPALSESFSLANDPVLFRILTYNRLRHHLSR